MKKVLCLALVLMMLAQFVVFSSATYVYENKDKNFTIQLPDDFDEVEEMKFIGDDDSNLGVTISEYTEDDKDYCIEDMSLDELKQRAQILAATSALGFASVQMEGFMEVVSVEKIKHQNGLNAVVMSLKTTVKTEDGESVRYQKVYEFTCKDHIYSFTYTSATGGTLDDLDESFDSITINEGEKRGLLGNFIHKGIPALVFFVIIVLGIVRFVRTPEKRKKGKL